MRKSLLLTFAIIAGVAFHQHDARLSTPLHAQAGANVVVNPNTYQDLRWRSIGPHRGGRSTAAAGVRTQPNVFYMGATGGGVWKTENYGITWTPITDGQIATGSIGAIDVSDSNPNVIYVGTGSEAIRSQRDPRARRVQVDRRRQDVAVRRPAATSGRSARSRFTRRIPTSSTSRRSATRSAGDPSAASIRTKDGGKTWQKVLFINDQTGVVSVAINWSNPNEIYAGAWRAQRKPWTIISGGPAAEGGVYKTTDGGDHWTRVSNGFPDDLIGKVWVDIAQSKPKVVYALVEAKGAKGGLYRSDDSGATWTLVNSEQSIRARPFYFNKVLRQSEGRERSLRHGAAPSSDRPTAARRSPPSRRRTATITSCGSIPDNPKIMVQTNDGGANVTLDGGRSWSTQMNQPTAEFYMVDTDEQFPYRHLRRRSRTTAPS